MSTRAGLVGCGKSRFHWDSIPEMLSPQPVAVPTTISRPTQIGGTWKKMAIKTEIQVYIQCTLRELLERKGRAIAETVI